jgi:phospholipase/carboxylesterase
MMEEYVFAEAARPKGAPLLFLLHGTGGDENDLMDLGRQVMPAAHLISPRGDVSENGAPRFFRRLGMGVFDMADLARATEKLAGFVRAQIARVEPSSVAALGYSNGANILASVLFAEPGLIDRSALMHPLIPFAPPPQPLLKGRRVLVTAGRHDQMVSWERTAELVDYFKAQGAVTEVFAHNGGHQLQSGELDAVVRFLAA